MKRIAAPAPRPQLEIRDLELVLALSACGTTAGASSELHITQSAVSRALAQAEERVGTKLFERGARGVVPTEAGQRLLAGAPGILQQLYALERQVAAPGLPPTEVRVVCECYTAYRWLPSAMAELRKRMPDLAVEVAADHTRDPVGALLRDEVDVALLTTSVVPKARGLGERALFSDEVVFVLSTQHPLAKAPSLTRQQLREHSLITSHTPPAERRWFLSSVFGRRVPKLEFLQFPLTEAIVDAARAGMGVAVLSEWMASGYLGGGGLVVKRLSTGPLRRPWRMAYRLEAEGTADRLRGALLCSAPQL